MYGKAGTFNAMEIRGVYRFVDRQGFSLSAAYAIGDAAESERTRVEHAVKIIV